MRRLSFAHCDPREVSDPADGVEIDGHPKLPEHLGTLSAPLYIAGIWLANNDARPTSDPPPIARDAVSRLSFRPVIGRSRECVIRSPSKISPSAFLPGAA